MIFQSLRKGDVVFKQARGVLGWFGTRGQRARGRWPFSWREPKVETFHVATMTGPDDEIEATYPRVREGNLRKLWHGERIAVYRPITLTAEQLGGIIQDMRAHLGAPYGTGYLALHWLDNNAPFVRGRVFFRKLHRGRSRVCSQFQAAEFEKWKGRLVGGAFGKSGLTFGKWNNAAQPDDIWFFVTSHPDLYECIVPAWTEV